MTFRAIPLALLLALASGGAAFAQRPAPGCRGVARPAQVAVGVQVDPAAIPLRRDLSSVQLAAISEHGAEGHRLLGLTNSVTSAAAQINLVVVAARTGQGVCVIPSEIMVSISHAGSWMAVASEVPAASCRDRIVQEHESQHARNNRESVAARLPNLVRSLRGLGLQPDLPIWGNTTEEATALLQARVQAIVEAEVNQMGRLRAERDAALDSPENYAAEDARIRELCGAE